jgi:adenylate cyclase class IV
VSTKYKEIELKYRADDVPLSSFIDFCLTQPGEFQKVLASGYDYFYENPKEPGSFARHRVGPSFNQLTLKRKLSDSNNFIRTEHNINLGADVTREQAEALCKELGYKFNTLIFKNVFVYTFDAHTFVYYVCYDKDLKELGRFIEIEMAEEYPWLNEEAAWEQLLELEASAKVLGLTPQRRMKKSLFEQFKRGL